MKHSFDVDTFPGRPKILFVGFSESTHTHSWIDLLDGADLNVRLFGLPSGIPPESWNVRTYVTAESSSQLNPSIRARLYPSNEIGRFYKRGIGRLFFNGTQGLQERWLAQVIHRWRPDIIHTLGLDYASYFFLKVRERFGLRGIGKWVVQVRGGPDLALHHLMIEHLPQIQNVLNECDQLIADNQQNYDYALDLGLRKEQVCPLGVIPGTGGVDVAQLALSRNNPSSQSRVVLWPKAYESPQSKGLPIFEAIKLVWDKIQPCSFYFLAATPETRLWYQTLPEEIRHACHIDTRIPRSRVLELLAQARVMLAPSLSDGIPNTMYEAMAAGALPIVSPLETIRPVVENERNVLFARNLYPNEIAEALWRAMTDDALVDSAVQRNLKLVQRIADRSKIRPRIIEYYERLAQVPASENQEHVVANK